MMTIAFSLSHRSRPHTQLTAGSSRPDTQKQSKQRTTPITYHTMGDLKTPLLDVHEKTTATPTDSNSGFKNAIYHLSFPAVLLWQFHLVLSLQDEVIPGPGVSAITLDYYILLFGLSGFMYRQAYHMANFHADSFLLHVPEMMTNGALALILLHRADLGLTTVLAGTCLLCVITTIIAIVRLLSLRKTERAFAEKQEDRRTTSGLQTCQIV
eukprot:scaffold5478_cov161-Amphora_coffeaeformis.AAC.5